jgi:prephenate dehydratase
MKKVSYLGPEATFTHLAFKKFFADTAVGISYSTIPRCIDAVANGEVDYAVVPIENTIEGSVNLTIDYLIHEQFLNIVAGMVAPIKQHLMVHPDREKSWQEVESVYSHPHAVAQCHKFLRNALPNVNLEYATSTGAAAKEIKENPGLNKAVIANELAATEYGLSIVKEDIHDFDYNHTRFVVLHKSENVNLEEIQPAYAYKERTMLVITLPSNQPGALHQVLSAFSWRKLDLSKIESRPMKTGIGNYFFIIDIVKKMDDVLIPGAIAELEALGCKVKVLGSFNAYDLENEISK